MMGANYQTIKTTVKHARLCVSMVACNV